MERNDNNNNNNNDDDDDNDNDTIRTSKNSFGTLMKQLYAKYNFTRLWLQRPPMAIGKDTSFAWLAKDPAWIELSLVQPASQPASASQHLISTRNWRMKKRKEEKFFLGKTVYSNVYAKGVLFRLLLLLLLLRFSHSLSWLVCTLPLSLSLSLKILWICISGSCSK